MIRQFMGMDLNHSEHDETFIRHQLHRICGEMARLRESDNRSLADEIHDIWLTEPDRADRMVQDHVRERMGQLLNVGPLYPHTISVHITDHGWFSIKYKHTSGDTIFPVITDGFHKDMRPDEPT